jgi:leucyl-tRNA synthetase
MPSTTDTRNDPGPTVPGADEDRPHRYTAALADRIETRWQAHWEEHGTFRTPNPGDDDFDAARPKFFCLDMFPYPSGAGLHVGHPEGYTATDIISRYKRHRGYNVLHPMGWDAFGLPAEQYAITTGVHPALTTRGAIDTFRRQLKRFGFSYDWSREFATIDPDYYRWTQWIWLQAYDAWYDQRVHRARRIAELIDELDTGRIAILPGRQLRLLAAGEPPPEDAISWPTMGGQERRALIDDHRLAYLAEQTVNWCPKLGTVLANEEVIDGRSERGGHPVLRRPLKQWMFRITAFADRLLDGLDVVRWPESTRTMQAAWIGRSEGAEIDFPLADGAPAEGETIRVYTTRPDTIFGATYMVVAPEHPLVDRVLAEPGPRTDVTAVRDYVEAARNRSDIERQADTKEKSGVHLGVDAVNPVTGARIGVWVADYVLMGYGHGAIMAVPGHDERDHAFAEAFGLPIVEVVRADEPVDEPVFAGAGTAINSRGDDVSLDGLPTAEAKARIIEWLTDRGLGAAKVNFKLRDWLFSRQRYWGEPFPVVYDRRGDHYPVEPSHLPVVLPSLEDYTPVESDDPTPLLAKAEEWVHTTAGEAGVSPDLLPPDTPVTRETNTMPGWAGSCWYYLRYCDNANAERPVSREAERYWLLSRRDGGAVGDEPFDPATHHHGGVDLYIGGAEHAVLHLLYARFWHKLLYDLGEVSTPEPFGRLFHQGMITSFAYQRDDKSLVPVDEVEARGELEHVETATGAPVSQVVAKMSKSLKNVINPDDVIEEFGADTFRLYEMYMGPLDQSKPWNPRDIVGPYRFLQRVWRLAVDETTGAMRPRDEADPDIEKHLHRTIRRVEQDIERLAMNTAIAAMIEFVKAANQSGGLTRDQLGRFLVVLSPFAPHLAEELWHRLGHDQVIATAAWPTCDESMLVDDTIELPVQIQGKVRGRVTVPAGADDDAVERAALADPRIAELLAGKTVRKVIIVKGKIVNIIAG